MRLLFLIISLLLGITCLQGNSQVLQRRYIRHTEKITNGLSAFDNHNLPIKANRLSNNAGNIVLNYEESLSDSIKTAILAAKKLWESKIPTKQPIYISILFEPLGNDISMASEAVYYFESGMSGCPSALYSQIVNRTESSTEYPDGIIILNSEINWNCSFSKGILSGYNIPTMIIRGIARCLGFGSSIVEDTNDIFSFYHGCPTFFDKVLYSNNIALSALSEKSAEIAEFVKSDNVYAHTNSQNFKIYSPGKFIQNLSLCYFDDENSIMSYSLGEGNINLLIDDKTVDVLREIGWDTSQPEIPIICNNISDNGIGSSYESHTFTLLKKDQIISDYSWKFLLKNKQGEYITISTGTSENFTVTNVLEPENYYININGDLEGKIECDYMVNNELYNASPFILSLELKPKILAVEDIKTVNEGESSFSVNCNVHYTGADYITVRMEEEFSTAIRRYEFYEPYIAHVKTGNTTNQYYSWLTIVVSNKYGSDERFFEFAPAYVSRNGTNTLITDVSTNISVERVILYRIDGTTVYNGAPSNLDYTDILPGIYLKKEIYNNGTVKIYRTLHK